MKWIRWLRLHFVLLYLILIILSITVPIYAGTTVTVNYNPEVTAGILNFKLTYVSGSQVNFTWDYGTGVDGIMIRGALDRYPQDIVSSNTTPSDGFLVYQGNGTSASDTNIVLDNNLQSYYYKAWGQNIDGSWQTITDKVYQESFGMTLISFILLLGILLIVNVIARNSFIPIKLMAAFAWAIPLVWVISYPPSFITAGSNIQTILILIIIGMLLICGFQAFRSPLQMGRIRIGKNGDTENTSEDSGSWRMPNFVKNSYRNVTGYQATGKERTNRMATSYNEYRRQVHASLFPRENNRRRR